MLHGNKSTNILKIVLILGSRIGPKNINSFIKGLFRIKYFQIVDSLLINKGILQKQTNDEETIYKEIVVSHTERHEFGERATNKLQLGSYQLPIHFHGWVGVGCWIK